MSDWTLAVSKTVVLDGDVELLADLFLARNIELEQVERSIRQQVLDIAVEEARKAQHDERTRVNPRAEHHYVKRPRDVNRWAPKET